jgi:Flp pilus assembly pilin Flp
MTNVRQAVKAFSTGERGQDLAEYCLLTALIALIGLGIFVHISGGLQTIWGGANTSLTTGNTVSGTQANGGASSSASATH